MKFLSRINVFSICILLIAPALSAETLITKGKIAPVFNLRNVKGELVKPFQEPKPVIVSFFFTDCPKCKVEIKELETFSQKYDDKVKIYLVGTSFKNDVDVSDDVDSFIKDLNVSFIPLVDKYKDIIKSYGVSAYPSLFLIDSKGQVVFSSSAYNEKTMRELEKKIKSVK